MRIQEIPVLLRVLRPDNEEDWLTNGDAFSREVYLGKDASPDGWSEITGTEMERLTVNKERLMLGAS